MFASDYGGGAVNVQDSSTENKPAWGKREKERERERREGGGRERAFQRGQKGKSLRFNGIKTAQFLYALPARITRTVAVHETDISSAFWMIVGGGESVPHCNPPAVFEAFFKASPACDFFLNPMVFRWRKKKRDMTVKMQHHWWVCSSCLAHGRTHPHFLCRRGAGRGVCDLCVRSASPCHNLRLNALLRTLNGKA